MPREACRPHERGAFARFVSYVGFEYVARMSEARCGMDGETVAPDIAALIRATGYCSFDVNPITAWDSSRDGRPIATFRRYLQDNDRLLLPEVALSLQFGGGTFK